MSKDYVLSTKMKYGAGGELVEAQFISFKPPTPRHISNLAPLRSEVLRAVQWAQEQSSDSSSVEVQDVADSDAEIGHKEMMMTIEMAPSVDAAVAILHVQEMLTTGKLGLIDGETPLTKPLMDEMSIEDLYGVTGQFIVNFIIPSL